MKWEIARGKEKKIDLGGAWPRSSVSTATDDQIQRSLGCEARVSVEFSAPKSRFPYFGCARNGARTFFFFDLVPFPAIPCGQTAKNVQTETLAA